MSSALPGPLHVSDVRRPACRPLCPDRCTSRTSAVRHVGHSARTAARPGRPPSGMSGTLPGPLHVPDVRRPACRALCPDRCTSLTSAVRHVGRSARTAATRLGCPPPAASPRRAHMSPAGRSHNSPLVTAIHHVRRSRQVKKPPADTGSPSVKLPFSFPIVPLGSVHMALDILTHTNHIILSRFLKIKIQFPLSCVRWRACGKPARVTGVPSRRRGAAAG